jgi:hypothetical protein
MSPPNLEWTSMHHQGGEDMKPITKLALTAVFAVLVLAALPAPASAEVKVGVRGGYYTDIGDPFLGGEALLRVSRRIYFNPNFEYVFVDDFTYWTLNGDFHYDFPVQRPIYVWAGAGLGLLVADPEGEDNGDTDAALNLLAGVGFQAGSVVPYFQAKVILDGGSEFVLAFGVRF